MASRRTGSIPASGWPANYEIRVSGTLAPEWSAWFAGLRVTSTEEETLIVGRLIDQAALHGALAKVRDLGLPLIGVRRLGADDDGDKKGE
jgi:hypothetical protein